MAQETEQDGKIAEWFDDKGYGWLECEGRRFFAHIKDFEPAPRRPKAGDKVRFMAGVDLKGRPCAKRVGLVKVGGAGRAGLATTALLVSLPLLAISRLPLPWWLGAGGMLLVSVATYRLYSHDKSQAVAGGWRVSEMSMHLMELLGGWPGGVLAQAKLRHKSSKPSYQVTFWAIVAAYQIGAVDVLADRRLSREVLGFLEVNLSAVAK